MPAKNSRKEFCEDSFYHLYNRGVEKRIIFLDDLDRQVFLSYLSVYLLPKDTRTLESILASPESSSKQKDIALKLLRMNNFHEEIELISYCLMPNHFHLLIWQKSVNAMDRFMNSLGTRYTTYFNRRHKRIGHLFQGVYKAVRIQSEEQLLHLTRYIHRNPLELLASQGLALRSYEWSSYPEYLGFRKKLWIVPGKVLNLFSKEKTGYISFVEDQSEDEKARILLSDVDIDGD